MRLLFDSAVQQDEAEARIIASFHRFGYIALVLFVLPATGKAHRASVRIHNRNRCRKYWRVEGQGINDGAFGKNTDSYSSAVPQTLSAEFVSFEKFRTEFGAAIDSQDIAGVSRLEDR